METNKETNFIYSFPYGEIKRYAGKNRDQVLLFSTFKHLQKQGYTPEYIDAKMLSHRFSVKQIKSCFNRFKSVIK